MATELVTNGDMELDSNWADLGLEGGDVQERSTTQVRGNTYSRHISVDAAGEGALSDAISVVSGTTYRVVVYFYVVSGVAEVKDNLASPFVFSITEATIGSWIRRTFGITASGTSGVEQIQLVSSGGAAEFYIDDLSIQELGGPSVDAETVSVLTVGALTAGALSIV